MGRHHRPTNELLFWLVVLAYAVLTSWSLVLYWLGTM